MILVCRGFIVFTSAMVAFHASGANVTHCTDKENIVFSCSIGKKTVSVCSSKNFTSSTGYLQYRFGKKEKLELVFPSLSDPPGRFVNRQWVMLGGGSEAHLRFNHGDYGYVVYSGLGSWGEYEGLAVEKAGKIISNNKCKETPLPISEIGNTGFNKLGLPVVESDEILGY